MNNALVMKALNQDNDPLPFVTLAALTANVLAYLQQRFDKTEDRAEQGSDRTQEQKEKEKAVAVAERVRAIEAFERRAGGNNRSRRERN